MKKSILTTAVLLFAATFALADDTTPSAAPPELLAAQAKYDAAIAAAVKAINEKYVAYLTAMKKKAMADGKLELAVAVDKEIKAAAEAKPKAPLTARDIVGRWTIGWSGQSRIREIKADGTCVRLELGTSDKPDGTWRVSEDKLIMTWRDGGVDTWFLPMKPTGKTAGHSSLGFDFVVMKNN